jgi:hypothetical protein
MQLTIRTTIFGLAGGPRVTQVELILPSLTLSVGDLIAAKVFQEVGECRSGQRLALSGEYWTEKELLAGAEDAAVPGEAAHEASRAQQAFAERAYMVVVDDERVFGLDERLTLDPESQVEFIKIMPMVGGV